MELGSCLPDGKERFCCLSGAGKQELLCEERTFFNRIWEWQFWWTLEKQQYYTLFFAKAGIPQFSVNGDNGVTCLTEIIWEENWALWVCEFVISTKPSSFRRFCVGFTSISLWMECVSSIMFCQWNNWFCWKFVVVGFFCSYIKTLYKKVA